MRSQEPGYKKIGVTCPDGRRSMWVRFTPVLWTSFHDIHTIEICAGREGDDDYACFRKSQIGLEHFHDLLKVLLTAEYIADLAGQEQKT